MLELIYLCFLAEFQSIGIINKVLEELRCFVRKLGGVRLTEKTF